MSWPYEQSHLDRPLVDHVFYLLGWLIFSSIEGCYTALLVGDSIRKGGDRYS